MLQRPSLRVANQTKPGLGYGSVTPSANSTEYASLENLRAFEEERLLTEGIQLKTMDGGEDSFYAGEEARIRRRRCRGLVVVGGVLAAVMVFWHRPTSSTTTPSTPSTTTTTVVSSTGPFSTLDPVADLGFANYTRPQAAPRAVQHHKGPLPTNAWYQNLILLDEGPPTVNHRAYSMPYVVDAAGPIPGLRVHPNHVLGSTNVVQLNVVENLGLTVGVSGSVDVDYSVGAMTPLGVTLEWEALGMSTPIVKGMPYATMRYESRSSADGLRPTVASEMPLRSNPVVDQGTKMVCSDKCDHLVTVERELEIVVDQSDFTWLVFVSEPVNMCCVKEDNGGVKLQVVDETEKPLVLRAAVLKLCSSGRNPVYCHPEQMLPKALLIGQGEYGAILRNHSHLYAGPNTAVKYSVDGESVISYTFDWDVQSMHNSNTTDTTPYDLLVFALTHHMDMMPFRSPARSGAQYCAATIIGPICLTEGSTWLLKEELPPMDFQAPRPPAPWSISALVSALHTDLDFRLSDFYERGAGDTYFSGKMLARLARVLMVADEVESLCTPSHQSKHLSSVALSADITGRYETECSHVSLPKMDKALDALRRSTEVWINGLAETPFVYDNVWGGFVSCGCNFDGDGCSNSYPDCPAFGDPGLNFGNAFYNDHHFHYGYHVYAAAVVSRFDPQWGRRMWDRVLLLVRDYANPSSDDNFFPMFRHKDWFQGNSWASGIISPPFRNGRNQESSSEAIAAYESVALYGRVMKDIFVQDGDDEKASKASEIEATGAALCATELRAAKTYYHNHKKIDLQIYPKEYQPHVVGIMWNTMVQFQTWFGAENFLAIGIQLLPLTAISEWRDEFDWSKQLYHELANSCDFSFTCVNQGWSILELALLATVGHPRLATHKAINLPSQVFDTPGGNGHTLSNTIWYLASRPYTSDPLILKEFEYGPRDDKDARLIDEGDIDCGKIDSCTPYVLNTIVDDYTCRQRIKWVMDTQGIPELEACHTVAVDDYPEGCGACNPDLPEHKDESFDPEKTVCPPCSDEQCSSELNRCPAYLSTYVCTEGASVGGCSPNPWTLAPAVCSSCCELSNCPKGSFSGFNAVKTSYHEKKEATCPACDKSDMQEAKRFCPSSLTAPYYCVTGNSKGGCSPLPWLLDSAQCTKCCKME